MQSAELFTAAFGYSPGDRIRCGHRWLAMTSDTIRPTYHPPSPASGAPDAPDPPIGVPGWSIDPASSPVPKDHYVSLSMRPLRGLIARSSACGPEPAAPDRPLLVLC